MIFSQSYKEVLNRDKTQTRRLAKPGDELRRSEDGVSYIYNTKTKRVRYCVGRDYAVQPGRSKHGLGKIRVNDLRMEKLLKMSLADAMDECILPEKTTRPDFPTEYLRGFIIAWERLYGGTKYAWKHNPEVVVISFLLIERYDD